MKSLLSFILASILSSGFAQEKLDDSGIFSARVSKVVPETSLVRLRVDFQNFRYLNKKDKGFHIFQELF